MSYVHLSCLQQWIRTSGRDGCELCKIKYRTERVYPSFKEVSRSITLLSATSLYNNRVSPAEGDWLTAKSVLNEHLGREREREREIKIDLELAIKGGPSIWGLYMTLWVLKI